MAATVVVALRSIGNILVVALLITPAATARLLTDRVIPMMLLSAAIGAATGVVGMIVAFQLNLATGALIVCIATATFAVVLLLDPRRRAVPKPVGRPAAQPEAYPHSH
jgi:manganese/iron transport system permease protein